MEWSPGCGLQAEMLQRAPREGGWSRAPRREAVLGEGWGGWWLTLSISAISRQDGGPGTNCLVAS